MASSRTASISNRSRSRPPARRNAAKNCAGRRTSGSNNVANLSWPPEKPRLPFATIYPSSAGRRTVAQRATERPVPYHDKGLQKNDHADEKRWTRKLGALIGL